MNYNCFFCFVINNDNQIFFCITTDLMSTFNNNIDQRDVCTYTSPRMSFTIDRPYTTRDLAHLCDLVAEKTYNAIQIQPEGVTEGGLLFVDWPGKRYNMYKSMRFVLLDGNIHWPWITPDTYDNWKNPEIPSENIFTPYKSDSMDNKTPKTRIAFFLKAFYGAPCFTQSELMIVASCLKEQGFVQHGNIPTKSELITRNNII